MPLSITEVTSTERFVGTPEQPRQVLHVTLERSMRDGPVRVEVTGREKQGSLFATEVRGAIDVPAGERTVRVDVPLDLPARAEVGAEIPVDVAARTESGARADAYGTVVVAEPGWTMVMVSHFHYDPVWWNTQASYTTDWDFVGRDWSTRPAFVDNGFALVEAHLKLAVRDPDYHFVLAELDYLKPYFDTYPEQRAVLRRLLAEGRVELVGGTYNEPNTNLTSSRDDDPELRLRHRVPARHPRRRPPVGLAAGRVRPRPAVPWARGQGRSDRQRVGARAAPPVGSAPPALGPGPDR